MFGLSRLIRLNEIDGTAWCPRGIAGKREHGIWCGGAENYAGGSKRGNDRVMKIDREEEEGEGEEKGSGIRGRVLGYWKVSL